MTDTVKLIEKLCQSFGPSGCEGDVARVIKEGISDITDEIKLDRMGNLIARMRFGDLNSQNRERVMVSAHMDEVGFMINEIKSDGYLGFDTVGGISDSVLAGRRVTVRTQGGDLLGVIASKAIHHKDKKERKKALSPEKLYIDIGAKSKEEAEELVRIGDFAVFDSEFYTFGEGLVKAKALDDRMGCATMIEAMRALKQKPIDSDTDVYFCFTVREEIGLSGAQTAAYGIRPDVAVVLETTAIADILDVVPSGRVADVGEGVVISVMDRSTVYDKKLVNAAIQTAKENGIKAQLKRYVSGGNDAGHIHKTADGARTLALSVPTRYLHSPACVASLSDHETQRDLLVALLRGGEF